MTTLPEPIHIYRHTRHIERIARRQETVLSCITILIGTLMADNNDLMNEIAKLNDAVAADQASDQAVVDQLDQIIADLKASGDTSAAIAAIQDVQKSITSVSSPNTPPNSWTRPLSPSAPNATAKTRPTRSAVAAARATDGCCAGKRATRTNRRHPSPQPSSKHGLRCGMRRR